MSKINELIQTLCPDGVEYKKLGEVCQLITGATPSKSVLEYWENGTISWMSSGEVNLKIVRNTEKKITQLGYDNASTKIVPVHSVIIALAGQGKTRGKVAINEIELCTNQSLCSMICNDSLNYKYLYYYLDGKYEELRAISNGNGSRGGLSLKILTPYEVPIPPLPVQEEIVRILDEYTDLEAELEGKLSEEIKLKQKQYEFCRDELLTFGDDVAVKKLGDIGFVTKLAGFEFTSYVQYQDFGKIIALRGLNVKNGKLVLDDIKYIDGSDFEKLKRSKLFKNDLLYTYVGTVGQVGLVDEDDKYYLAPNVALIRVNSEEELSPWYLTQFLLSGHLKYQLFLLSNNSTLKNITMTNIREFQIPVPSLTEQERIVKILDKYDTYTRDMISTLNTELESRKKQYAYYRDQLLTFKRKE